MEMQIFSPDDLALMGHLALCNPGLNGKTIDSIIIFLIALRGKGGREGEGWVRRVSRELHNLDPNDCRRLSSLLPSTDGRQEMSRSNGRAGARTKVQGFLRNNGGEFGDQGSKCCALQKVTPKTRLAIPQTQCESPVFFRTNAGGRFLVVVSVGRSSSLSLSPSPSPRVFLSTVRGRICSENESDFARRLTPEKTEETQKEANTAMAIGHHGWTDGRTEGGMIVAKPNRSSPPLYLSPSSQTGRNLGHKEREAVRRTEYKSRDHS